MTTAAATPAGVGALAILREQARTIHHILRVNVADLSQEGSLIQPQPGGNCLNWNVGHLVCVNDQILPLVEQAPVLGTDKLKQYGRGSAALRDGKSALPLSQLLEAWDEQATRLDAGLAALAPEALDKPAPTTPRNNPNETVGSLLSIVMFHQSYHVGQTGLLRRIAGKEGAVK